MHILTEKQAKEILASDDHSCDLAERYVVDYVTISKLRRGETWKHLKGKRYTGLGTDNKTGVKGVSPIRKSGKYDARFKLNRKLYCLGAFDTIDQAAKAVTKTECPGRDHCEGVHECSHPQNLPCGF